MNSPFFHVYVKHLCCLLLFTTAVTYPAMVFGQADTVRNEDGKIQSVTWKQDSGTRMISFDEHTGRQVSITHQGNFNGCGMPVGTDTFFTAHGKIEKTLTYENRKSLTEEGCHSTWTTTKQVIYHTNGKPKELSLQKSCYECGSCDCGIWISYNEKGKVIRKKKKGDCYNQQPCP